MLQSSHFQMRGASSEIQKTLNFKTLPVLSMSGAQPVWMIPTVWMVPTLVMALRLIQG